MDSIHFDHLATYEVDLYPDSDLDKWCCVNRAYFRIRTQEKLTHSIFFYAFALLRMVKQSVGFTILYYVCMLSVAENFTKCLFDTYY